MSTVKLSILDRANTRVHDGATVSARQIFAEVTRRAKAAEQLGYHRFWVAEHHSVPGIAGSAPTLLIPHLAAATSRIRLGTGGICAQSPALGLPNTLARCKHGGGRADAGLGASVFSRNRCATPCGSPTMPKTTGPGRRHPSPIWTAPQTLPPTHKTLRKPSSLCSPAEALPNSRTTRYGLVLAVQR